MAKIALSLEPEQIWGTLDALGFGQVTASGFPGESAGLLSELHALAQVADRQRCRTATACR